MLEDLKPYEKRFVLEYAELVDRMTTLEWTIASIESGMCDFETHSDLQDLYEQLFAMRKYRHVLMKRACSEELTDYVRQYCNEY